MLSEIKRILEESGKPQKSFDGIYRSISSRYDGMRKIKTRGQLLLRGGLFILHMHLSLFLDQSLALRKDRDKNRKKWFLVIYHKSGEVCCLTSCTVQIYTKVNVCAAPSHQAHASLLCMQMKQVHVTKRQLQGFTVFLSCPC